MRWRVQRAAPGDEAGAADPVLEAPTSAWLSPGVIVTAPLVMPVREPHHGACRCEACHAALYAPDIRFA